MPCKKRDEVHELIDWARLEKLLSGVHANRTDEKAWPPLMMFKALLLQSWYRLSDPGLEKQLARDLLFRRLIGRDLSESVADQSTLWRFRQKLEGGSLLKRLRPEVNEKLAGQGVYMGMAQARYLGISRNRTRFDLMCVA